MRSSRLIPLAGLTIVGALTLGACAQGPTDPLATPTAAPLLRRGADDPKPRQEPEPGDDRGGRRRGAEPGDDHGGHGRGHDDGPGHT